MAKSLRTDRRVFVQGVALPIYQTVLHSQGKQAGTRAEITAQEIEKCKKYENLISPQRALAIHKMHRYT